METIIGQNIRSIRLKLNLSVKRYSELTGISRTTIVNIEQGHTGIKFNTIESLIGFSGYSIEEISSPKFIVHKNLSQKLYDKYKNDTLKRQFFLNAPKISQAIQDKLLDSLFFQDYREINEIVNFFNDLGIQVKGTSLQNELKKHTKVEIISHPNKKGTNFYKAKIR